MEQNIEKLAPTKAPAPNEQKRALRPLPETYRPLEDRQLSADTAKTFKFTYHQDGPFIHTYPRFRTINGVSRHVANQFRMRGKKDFRWEGDQTKMELIGQHAFPAGCAKSITITEGACDVGAAYELQGSRWPCVGVTAASTAVRECRDNLAYLNSFDKIVVCLDSDEPGQTAALRLSEILPVGKVHILTLKKHKDPNDYLRAGMRDEFVKEWWGAPLITPAGLKVGSGMWDEIITVPQYNYIPYPWEGLTEKTYGLRLSEVVLLNAKTGVGKTTITNAIAYQILRHSPDAKVGNIRLEETNRDSALNLLSCHAGKRLHLPDVWESVSQEELRHWYDDILNNDRVIFFDHFGSNSIHVILDTIRHMHSMGCQYIVLDHLSIIVSDQSGDERKQLDEISTKLKTLCMELKICVIAVIHQNREGQIRGSDGPGQLGNTIIKLERDMESPDDWRRNVIKMIIQKDRFAGNGGTCYVFYDREHNVLVELTEEEIAVYEKGGTKSHMTNAQFPTKDKDDDWDFGLPEDGASDKDGRPGSPNT